MLIPLFSAVPAIHPAFTGAMIAMILKDFELDDFNGFNSVPEDQNNSSRHIFVL